MKKQYYSPVKLAVGVLLFGISMLCIGMLLANSVKDGVQDIKDMLYTIGLVSGFIAMIIGEGLILDAASYDVKDDAVVSGDEQ